MGISKKNMSELIHNFTSEKKLKITKIIKYLKLHHHLRYINYRMTQGQKEKSSIRKLVNLEIF